jgi:hypothetical protein
MSDLSGRTASTQPETEMTQHTAAVNGARLLEAGGDGMPPASPPGPDATLVAPAPCFQPWVGEKWQQRTNALGIRLLVLGESHYCRNPEEIGTCYPNLTIDVVEQYAIAGPGRFFTGITQVLSGRKKWQLTQSELSDIWAGLVFYNYVPVYVAAGPRVRPSSEMFELGAAPFARLIAEYQPEAVLVCGLTLWWWVLKGWSGFTGDPSKYDFYRLGPAVAARMMHPSAGFSSAAWRPTVLGLLNQVRNA